MLFATQPLITTVRQHQLCFLGHIPRKPDDEPCRKYALFVPTHGRRETREADDKLYILLENAWGHKQRSKAVYNCPLIAKDRSDWKNLQSPVPQPLNDNDDDATGYWDVVGSGGSQTGISYMYKGACDPLTLTDCSHLWLVIKDIVGHISTG